MRYSERFSLAERLALARDMRARRPGFVPVIAEPQHGHAGPALKFLLDPACTGQDLLAQIRARTKLAAHEALFVYVDDVLCPLHRPICAIYLEHVAEDEHLYTIYARESTFGGGR